MDPIDLIVLAIVGVLLLSAVSNSTSAITGAQTNSTNGLASILQNLVKGASSSGGKSSGSGSNGSSGSGSSGAGSSADDSNPGGVGGTQDTGTPLNPTGTFGDDEDSPYSADPSDSGSNGDDPDGGDDDVYDEDSGDDF